MSRRMMVAPRRWRRVAGAGWSVAALAGAMLLAGCVGVEGAGSDPPATADAPPTAGDAGTASTTTIRLQAGQSCIEPADAAEPVWFPTAAGGELAGAVLGEGPAGVVLAHESDGNVCDWLPYARTLAGDGYQVLMFDFTGNGASVGTDPELAAEVTAAVTALRERGATKVVLVGASMGGTGALTAATGIEPPVDGVVSLSGATFFEGVDAEQAVPELTVPVLFAAAEDDSGFANGAERMHELAGSRTKELLVVPGFDHGVDLTEDERVTREVAAFLAEHAK